MTIKAFESELLALIDNSQFYRFDSFIIEKMGQGLYLKEYPECFQKQARHEAFCRFREVTRRQEIASMPTMRRWFGIGGFHCPSREEVYQICFAMDLDRDKASEYLTKGLGEPSFQINDYREMIFLYGLENHLTYENCLFMIQIFESNLTDQICPEQTHNTHYLKNQYEQKKDLPMEDFVAWMAEQAGSFKGYSQTMLDTILGLRKSILKFVREYARERLTLLLEEAGYPNWRQKYGRELKSPPRERQLVRRFVVNHNNRKQNNISKNLTDNIKEMLRLTFSGEINNAKLRAEIYGDHGEMSAKKLSDLFNTPKYRERLLHTQAGLRHLEECAVAEEIPDWIREFGERFRGKKYETVSEAAEDLSAADREWRRRNIMIQRKDILPMIHYVAQHRYIKERTGGYNREEAVRYFLEFSEPILHSCGMEKVNNEYLTDSILLACFQKGEMFSYAEALDILNGRAR